MIPTMLVDVEVEVLDEAGEVEKRLSATVRSIRNDLVFLHGDPEGPYCIAGDECEGFWCCDPTSRERLSKESVETCRTLQKGASS